MTIARLTEATGELGARTGQPFPLLQIGKTHSAEIIERKRTNVQFLYKAAHRCDGDCHPDGDSRRHHDREFASSAVSEHRSPEIQLQASYVGADAQTWSNPLPRPSNSKSTVWIT